MDILLSVTSTVRRLLSLVSLVALTGAAALAAAGPASADTPEGWPEREPVGILSMLLLLGGVPLLVFVVITLLAYAPSLARGESIAPGNHEPDSEWIGGPRKAAGELAAPDSEGSAAGGAGGTW